MPPEGIERPPRDGEQPGSPLTGHLGEVAEEAGLVMRRAPLTPNTRLAFEASEFAKDMGLFEPFHRACYRVFWEEGVNLGKLPVLQQIGEQVGLDPAAMEERLTAGHYTAAAQTQYEEALCDRREWHPLLHHRSVLLLRRPALRSVQKGGGDGPEGGGRRGRGLTEASPERPLSTETSRKTPCIGGNAWCILSVR